MTTRPTPLRIDVDLLDRQIVDVTGAAVGKVDDVELEMAPDGRLRISALLCGMEVLGHRMGGRVGHLMARTARRLAPTERPRPLRIPWPQVARIGSAVELNVHRELLADPPLETWLRTNLIDKIRGRAMRASDFLGRVAYDRDGTELGYIDELLVAGPPDDQPVVTHVLVARRRTRLFGYERDEIRGPRVIQRLATWIQGPVVKVPIDEIRLTNGPGPGAA